MDRSQIDSLFDGIQDSVSVISKNTTASPETVVGLEYWYAFDNYTSMRIRLFIALFVNMWNDVIPFHYFLYTLLYRIVVFPIQIAVRHIQMPFWIGWCAWKHRGEFGVGWVFYITFKRIVTHPVILLSNMFPHQPTEPSCAMYRMVFDEGVLNPFTLYNRLVKDYPTESRRILFDIVAHWTIFEQAFWMIEQRLWK